MAESAQESRTGTEPSVAAEVIAAHRDRVQELERQNAELRRERDEAVTVIARVRSAFDAARSEARAARPQGWASGRRELEDVLTLKEREVNETFRRLAALLDPHGTNEVLAAAVEKLTAGTERRA